MRKSWENNKFLHIKAGLDVNLTPVQSQAKLVWNLLKIISYTPSDLSVICGFSNY